MHKDKSPSFSQVVCSALAVQDAFTVHRPTRFWWNAILLLHGKPTDSTLSGAERTRRVAEGFKFYASLYRVLALIFLGLAPVLAVLCIVESTLSFWAGASLLGGVYLWFVSGLGYAGAKAYETGREQGIPSLVAFMVMIVAFLSLFVAALSVVAHQHAWLGTVPNLVGLGALFVFGIGSYMIEIIYLATERQT